MLETIYFYVQVITSWSLLTEQDSSPWDSLMETSILELFISMKEAHWIRKLDQE